MVLTVKNLKGGYGDNLILNGISFFARQGDMVYVLGANGSGKTTLFNIIVGYKQKLEGQIKVDGKDVTTLPASVLAKLVAYIPQQHFPIFNYTVKDVAVMGRASHLSKFGTPRQKDYDIVYGALDMLGIREMADREYMEISGGERQLVLIARAICQQAKIIVMDEPLQSLDFVNQAMVTRTLKTLSDQGYTIIMSTHSAINNYSKNAKVLLMGKDGTAAFGNIEDIITQNCIQKAFGIPMQTIMNKDERGGNHLFCLPIYG